MAAAYAPSRRLTSSAADLRDTGDRSQERGVRMAAAYAPSRRLTSSAVDLRDTEGGSQERGARMAAAYAPSIFLIGPPIKPFTWL